MERRLRKPILILMCFFSLQMWAQQKEISGMVQDEDGMPLPGVNVIVQNTNIGTVTDFDGNFSLSVPDSEDTVIEFSSLGFSAQQVKIGAQTNFKITMEVDAEALDEVVITSFGIERKEKSLGYAVQEVKSEQILEGNNTNVVSGLQGKVSGVTISNSGGAPGSSTAILIRGGTSITGNNQPLFVVDGIPIDNSTGSSLTVASVNRAADLNPEDIESISVLKGPAAAALYGIQAAEGAVIVTTKKGKAGKSMISYSGTFSIDEVLGTPDVQQQFGQGTQILSTDGFSYVDESSFSWGPSVNNEKTYNHLDGFFETAVTQNHNVSYSGGSEKSTMYLSIGDLSQKGVIEGTNYDKTSFKINSSSQLGENLTVGASANYIVTEIGSTKQGNASGSSFSSLLSYPINVDIHNYYDENGSQKMFYQDQTFDNPYWSLENSPNDNKVNRLIGMVNISYDFLNDFNLSYKLGTDYYNETSKRVIGTGSLIENRGDGYISQFQRENRKTTSNLILSYNKEITEDFEIDALIGNMVEDYKVHSIYTYGDGFLAPGIYSIGNVSKENQSITELISRRRAVGVFGELKIGWRDALFLNFTGRNDWSSTLPEDKRSFFYPSIGTSAVITDLLEQQGNVITSDRGLSFLKFRATWAQAGKDAPIGALNSFLGTDINPLASSAYTYNGVDIGNPQLEPEFTNSYEIGVDSRFFKNRLGLDLSLYYSKSENQILEDIRVPPSAGTFYATLNGGSIINKGIEALVTAKIFDRNKAFQWDMIYNFGLNKSEVVELPGQLDEVYLSDSWTFSNTAAGAAILNGSLFGLRGYKSVRNDQGELIIGADGIPELETVIFDDVNRLPDWTLGITNNLSYKNFNLSFLLDIVEGQEAYNATKSALIYYGLGEETLDRSADGVRVVDGVYRNGNENTTEVTDQQYYQQYFSQNAEHFIEDASFARLRYATLSYNIPTDLLDKLNIVSAKISVTGRNLFTITDYSGVDPEVNTYGAGIQGAGSMGIDNLGTPNTKGFDLGLRFKF